MQPRKTKMSKKNLKSMLNNLISDNIEEATLDLHNYLTDKMREISGISQPEANDITQVNPEEVEE